MGFAPELLDPGDGRVGRPAYSSCSAETHDECAAHTALRADVTAGQVQRPAPRNQMAQPTGDGTADKESVPFLDALRIPIETIRLTIAECCEAADIATQVMSANVDGREVGRVLTIRLQR